MVNRSKSGGAIAQGGFHFQDKIAAWFSVQILAEKSVQPMWGLSSGSTYEALYCETTSPVDDLNLVLSDNTNVFIQAKTSISISDREDSEINSVCKQFAEQFAVTQLGHSDFPSNCTQLVLATSSSSPQAVRKDLSSALNKLRAQPENKLVNDIQDILNKEEKKALDNFYGHLNSYIEGKLISEKPEEALNNLLRKIWVQTFDLGDDEINEREALRILGETILRDPSKAKLAWQLLIEFVRNKSILRGGVDRDTLQKYLLNHEIDLRVVRGFQDDITKLTSMSENALNEISSKSYIHLEKSGIKDKIKIDRDVSGVLYEATRKSPYLLLIGEPGAGKSGVIYDFANTVKKSNSQFVLFLADQFEAKSLGTFTSELLLQNDLKSIFSNWPTIEPKYLIIDALDAARSAEAQDTFRSLIKDKDFIEANNWRVVVSIRKFDLRYSDDIRRLFKGKPPNNNFAIKEFNSVAHIDIPDLSDSELIDLASKNTEINQFIKISDAKLVGLCKNLFNFSLIADLICNGIELKELSPIENRLELIDVYWDKRIDRGNFTVRRDRSEVLHHLTSAMVSRQKMRVENDDFLSQSVYSQHLAYLLSSNVLNEGLNNGVQNFFYSHHIIFDYAIYKLHLATLELEGEIELLANPNQFLFLRPSTLMLFQERWRCNKTYFWDSLFTIHSSDNVSSIAKIIPTIPIADGKYDSESFKDFYRRLTSKDQHEVQVSTDIIKHLSGALLVNFAQTSDFKLNSWVDFLEESTRVENIEVVLSSVQVLREICNTIEHLNQDEIKIAGVVARRILEFAWEQESLNLYLATEGIRLVCKTFSSDDTESEKLLRRALDFEHVKKYGSGELYWLAQGLVHYCSQAPELATDLYLLAFEHLDDSEEVKSFGPRSQILQLLTTSRQEYDGIRYSLSEDFEEFLRLCPKHATYVIAEVIKKYIDEKHPISRPHQHDFVFRGINAALVNDYSHIWDSGDTYSHDYPIKMLNQFDEFIANFPDDANIVELLNILIGQNKSAVIWSHLFEWGALKPENIGKYILPLTWCDAFVSSPDTIVSVGEFIKANAHNYNSQERAMVEETILAMPGYQHTSWAEPARLRNRLLKCLSPDLEPTSFLTAGARKIVEDTNEIFPDNIALFRMGRMLPANSDDFEDEDSLDFSFSIETSNKQIDSSYISELKKHSKVISSLMISYQSSQNSDEFYSEILKSIKMALPTLNSKPDLQKEEHHLWEETWSYISEAAHNLLADEDLARLLNHEDTSLVKEIFTMCLSHAREERDWSLLEIDFENSPSWAINYFISATKGITFLIRYPEYQNDHELIGLIRNLSQDKDPGVRYQIVSHLSNLHKFHNTLFWDILNSRVIEELNPSLFQGLNKWIIPLLFKEPEKTIDVVSRLFNKFCGHPSKAAEKIRELCLLVQVKAYIAGVFNSKSLLQEKISKFPQYANELTGLVFSFRKEIYTLEDECRNKYREVLELIFNRIMDYPFKDDANYRVFNEAAMNFVDKLAAQFHYLSEKLIKELDSSISQEKQNFEHQLNHLFSYFESVYQTLANYRHPSVIHHLVEALYHLLERNPEKVFNMLHHVISSSRGSGYEYEWLAKDRIIQILKIMFADHRHILQRNENQASLISILDVFVDAGWLEARELTYQLEDVLR